MRENINYTYEAKPIDTAVLSVLDVTSDGKIVSAADWTALWNAVLVRINHIDEYCSDISALAINWQESTAVFEKAVTDINTMFNTLSNGFIYYGDEAPTDEHIRLWVQPSSEVDTKSLVTKGELTTTVNARTASTIKMWQPRKNYRVGDVCFFHRIKNVHTPYGAILMCETNHTASSNLEPTTAELGNWTVYPINAARSIRDSQGNVIHETYATKDELPTSIKDGSGDCSVYQESEKDDTKISLAFTDVRPPEKEDYIGIYNRAEYIGKNATALGTSVAKGDRSLTSGSSNLVEGKGAIALGTDNLVIGASSAALGYANFVNGEMSVALGASNAARNKYAVALNGFNNAYGKNSLATGNDTSAIGNYTLTGGQGTYATGGASVALGNSTKAEGECSFTTGYETQSNEFCQTVVGRHNNLDKSKNALFVVGNGYDTDDEDKPIKRNAFTVNMDGTATLYKNPVKSMDVATKDYVDKKIEELKALIK